MIFLFQHQVIATKTSFPVDPEQAASPNPAYATLKMTALISLMSFIVVKKIITTKLCVCFCFCIHLFIKFRHTMEENGGRKVAWQKSVFSKNVQYEEWNNTQFATCSLPSPFEI